MTPQKIGAFFDIDGTLTSDNVWRGIMQFFSRRGERRGTQAVFWAYHFPVLLLRYAGLMSETTFRREWALHLPWYFKGYDETQMNTLTDWVVQNYVPTCQREDALEILKQHLAEGHVVALVSAAPTPIVEAIARLWNVPHVVGSPVEMKNGRYTGRVSAEPCLDAYKERYLKQYLDEQGLAVDANASYAYADSFSDMGLFDMVGNPVAVYPDKQLAALAKERGWKIVDDKKESRL